MIINNWLYVNTPDNKSRFVLGSHGNNPLLCIGINPSTATPDKLDPAMKWLSEFSKNKGYDGFIMINIYPQRGADPKKIDKQRNDDLHRENMYQINGVLKNIFKNNKQTILAIWGVSIKVRPWLKDCLHELVKNIQAFSSDYHWKCLGLTKEGHPSYPFGIKSNVDFIDFDINTYLKEIGI